MFISFITILTHGDSDGVCSAALATAALKEDYREIRVTNCFLFVGLLRSL